MSGIDLTPARDALAQYVLLDECIIRYNENGNRDAVLNTSTGALEDAADSTFYEGACSVRPEGETSQDPSDEILHEYIVKIPWDAAAPSEGMELEVTVSQDPALVGLIFRIREVDYKTLRASRVLHCELETVELEDV